MDPSSRVHPVWKGGLRYKNHGYPSREFPASPTARPLVLCHKCHRHEAGADGANIDERPLRRPHSEAEGP